MESKLQQFIDNAFAPYGDFPAKTEITRELLANLTEKYNDLKASGKSDEEAYAATTKSFGDPAEIMEQLPHGHEYAQDQTTQEAEPEDQRSIHKMLKQTFKQAKAHMGLSKFSGVTLDKADLSDSRLVQEDFNYTSLSGANFDRSDLSKAAFRATDLRGASFRGTNLTEALFAATDLQDADFTGANMTHTKLKAAAFKGVSFKDATLARTDFRHSDLSGISFEGMELEGVVFDGTSLKNTSFKNAVLRNVSFHHSDVKHTIFDGATMDKVTYALLKGAKANLDGVTVE